MNQTVAEVLLNRVLPGDLAACWPFVERGLREALSHGNEPWTPKDIHDRILDQSAALYVREDGLGFLVLEQCVEPISRRKYLNVWVMWSEPTKAKGLRDQFVAWLDAMRDLHDCAWVQFMSPRNGWAAMQPQFQPYMMIWRSHAPT